MSGRAGGGTPPRRRAAPVRPAVLGVFAFALAFPTAWVAYERTLPAPDALLMAWWHGGGHAHGAPAGGGAGGPGTYLALAAAALYVLLPLLLVASRAARAVVSAHRGTAFAARAVFAALAAAAAALALVPVTALALALGPGSGTGLWEAVRADAPAVLGRCLPTGFLLSVALGVPWTGAPPSLRTSTKEVHPC